MSVLRRLSTGLLTFALATSPLLIPAAAVAQPSDPPETGGVGIRLLEAPVSLQDDPRAQSYIIDNLPPGTEITRRIEVQNSSSSTREISLYPGAASIADTDAGGFDVGDDRAVNELTTWMTVAPAEVKLASNGTAEAKVTIKVPKDAPEGEQYAVVWAQTAGDESGSGIQNVSRAGIRTYLSVGPGNGPPADFDISELTAQRADSGAPEVVATVENTGGRALDPRGTLTLAGGPGGISAAPVSSSGGSIAPGKSGTITFALDPAVPSGPWEASVEISSGLVKHTSQGKLTFPDEGSVTAGSSDSGGGMSTGVLIAIAVAVVLAAVIAAALLVRRNRKMT
jgi:hypothetical protein